MKPMLWPLLGLVRFFLALVVAGTHLAHFAPGNAIAHWFDGLSAFVAVIGFLVVSGFSIAASYEKSPAGFYARRVLRILPLYVLAIAAAAFCTTPFGGKVVFQDSGVLLAPSSSSVLQNLFFLQGSAPSWVKRQFLWMFLVCLAIAVGVVPRLAATLEALMLAVITVLVWMPGISASPTTQFQATGFLISAAIAAGAWIVADSYRDSPWLGARPAPLNR